MVLYTIYLKSKGFSIKISVMSDTYVCTYIQSCVKCITLPRLPLSEIRRVQVEKSLPYLVSGESLLVV